MLGGGIEWMDTIGAWCYAAGTMQEAHRRDNASGDVGSIHLALRYCVYKRRKAQHHTSSVGVQYQSIAFSANSTCVAHIGVKISTGGNK